MFGIQVKFRSDADRVTKAADRAAYRNLAHAAASIRKDARLSVERASGPSAPGEPIHTRRGKARRAIEYEARKDEALVGFNYYKIGDAMRAHEHGGRRGQNVYPERPTMRPALERNIDRFHEDWRASIW